MTAADAILVAEGVRKTYRGAVEVEVLEGSDRTVHPVPMIAALLGEACSVGTDRTAAEPTSSLWA